MEVTIYSLRGLERLGEERCVGHFTACPRTDRDGPRGGYRCWSANKTRVGSVDTQYSLPDNNPLLLVVRRPRRLHKVRLGARKVLGQVLEQRDGDFDVLFFLYVVGHVLVGHRRRFAPAPRRPRRWPVDDRRVARAVMDPFFFQGPQFGFGPPRRLWPPARRDDGRRWFCDRPRGRLRVQGRRARVVAPARAKRRESLRFRSRPRRRRAPPRVGRPREPPLRGRDAGASEDHGGLQPC